MYNLYSSTLTSKGQATIPSQVRKELGIKFGQKVYFRKNGKGFIIEAAPDFFSLRGSIKSKIKYSDRKADKTIAKMFTEEYRKKHGKTS